MYHQIIVRGKRKRTYVQAGRADTSADTRDRILDAIIGLHEEVGPFRTTIKAIAEEAGVQRLTVYRHFPNQSEMIAACSARWNELQPPPDLATMTQAAPRRRSSALLLALYRYYRSSERMLTQVIGDAPRMPDLQIQLAPFSDYLAQVVAELERGWRRTSAQRRNTLRHAVQFTTWRSLAALTDDDAASARLVMRWCDAATETRG